MYEMIEQKRGEIKALCRGLGVRRLDLFGSALGDSFDPDSSDVDLLVEFDIRPGFDYCGTYFGLKEAWSGSSGFQSMSLAPQASEIPIFASR